MKNAVLSAFRESARPSIKRGLPVNLDNCIEMAVEEAICPFNVAEREKISKKSLRDHIWAEEDLISDRCRKIILELEKRALLMDIRKTVVEVALEDFAKQSPYRIHYVLRGNSTVGISAAIPNTRQKL